MLLASGIAHGAPVIQDCATGDAPSAYVTNGKCADLCTWDADGFELTCDLNRLTCNANPSLGELYAVKFAAANGQFSAFGKCQSTNPATEYTCCKVVDSSSEILRVTLIGRDQREEPIGFRWDSGGVVKSFVPTHSSGTGAYAWGRGKNDVVVGSDYAGTDYIERLYGEDGDDDLHTNDGGGRAYGGNGADSLDGGDGEDQLFGEAGNDRLEGGANDDLLDGGRDSDELYGQAGDDVLKGFYGQFDILDGGDDDDVLCDTRLPQVPGSGCPGANTFYGGDGFDKAWSSYNQTCAYMPAPGPLLGDDTVEVARPAALSWDAVLDDLVGVEESTSAPWPECQ